MLSSRCFVLFFFCMRCFFFFTCCRSMSAIGFCMICFFITSLIFFGLFCFGAAIFLSEYAFHFLSESIESCRRAEYWSCCLGEIFCMKPKSYFALCMVCLDYFREIGRSAPHLLGSFIEIVGYIDCYIFADRSCTLCSSSESAKQCTRCTPYDP